MSHKFKIGDVVIGNYYADSYSITRAGVKGEIIDLPAPGIILLEVVVGYSGAKERFPVNAGCFDLVGPSFDPKKPVKQRCGRPAEIEVIDGNGTLHAKATMPSGSVRCITYQPDGYFYKRIPSDIDLVNK